MASDNFRSDPERSAQLAVYLALHSAACGVTPAPGLIARTVVAMQKAARSAKRAAEFECNHGYSGEWGARAAGKLANNVARLNAELLAMVTVRHPDGSASGHCAAAPTVTLGGDPRGSCGTLHIPGQPGDGWGDGFAIY